MFPNAGEQTPLAQLHTFVFWSLFSTKGNISFPLRWSHFIYLFIINYIPAHYSHSNICIELRTYTFANPYSYVIDLPPEDGSCDETTNEETDSDSDSSSSCGGRVTDLNTVNHNPRAENDLAPDDQREPKRSNTSSADPMPLSIAANRLQTSQPSTDSAHNIPDTHTAPTPYPETLSVKNGKIDDWGCISEDWGCIQGGVHIRVKDITATRHILRHGQTLERIGNAGRDQNVAALAQTRRRKVVLGTRRCTLVWVPMLVVLVSHSC